jgi:rRNA biogenesis protein RRP5
MVARGVPLARRLHIISCFDVQVTVRHVLSDGLLVSFLKYFHGTVDLFHLPHESASKWRATFKTGTRVPARILYVDPSSKQV